MIEFKIEVKDGKEVHMCRSERALAIFPLVIERHDKDTFQREGHFVPRMVDHLGSARDWDGPLLFVGVVNWELRDAYGKVTDSRQTLRVIADTPAELFRLLDLRIRESFFACFVAQQVQSQESDTVKRLNDENTQLRARLGEAK